MLTSQQVEKLLRPRRESSFFRIDDETFSFQTNARDLENLEFARGHFGFGGILEGDTHPHFLPHCCLDGSRSIAMYTDFQIKASLANLLQSFIDHAGAAPAASRNQRLGKNVRQL